MVDVLRGIRGKATARARAKKGGGLMDKKDTRFEQDKQNILEWMTKNCHGYRNARIREGILPYVLIYRTFPTKETKDRHFREIMSSLIHEGHTASSNRRGYWVVPIHTRDRGEVEAVLECYYERKAKALALIADCDRLINEFVSRKSPQEEFTFYGGKK